MFDLRFEHYVISMVDKSTELLSTCYMERH